MNFKGKVWASVVLSSSFVRAISFNFFPNIEMSSIDYDVLTLFRSGFFGRPGTEWGGGGGASRSYTCNSTTAYGIVTKFIQNGVLIVCLSPWRNVTSYM